jgi:hypothetical protein
LDSGESWLTGAGKKFLNWFLEEAATLSFCATVVAEIKIEILIARYRSCFIREQM